MDVQAIVSSIFSEAGAAWLAIIVTIVLAAVGWVLALRRRQRPPRVIVQEIERTKLLDIHPSQRDRLRVFYADDDATETPIENLMQKEIVIYNNGTRDIVEPLEFRLKFTGPASAEAPRNRFLRWFFDDGKHASAQLLEETVDRADSDESETVCHGVNVKLEYLNSYPAHRDYVKAYLISDGQVDIALWGKESGKGWSARFVTLDRAQKLANRAVKIVFFPELALIVLAALVFGLGALFEDLIMLVSGAFAATCLMILIVAGSPIEKMVSHRWLGARLPSEFKPKTS